MPDTDDRLIERGRELAGTKSVNEQVAEACGFTIDRRLGDGAIAVNQWRDAATVFEPDTDKAAALDALEAYAKKRDIGVQFDLIAGKWKWTAWFHFASGNGDFCTAICRAILAAEEKRNV